MNGARRARQVAPQVFRRNGDALNELHASGGRVHSAQSLAGVRQGHATVHLEALPVANRTLEPVALVLALPSPTCLIRLSRRV
jgi:hypothetical protein